MKKKRKRRKTKPNPGCNAVQYITFEYETAQFWNFQE